MCATTPDWFTSGSISFELIKGLPAVLITLGLGLVALLIQKHQANVATAKLNLDLFERRYKIFDLAWTELSNAKEQCNNRTSSPQFTNEIPQAKFLFGSDISDYMHEISERETQLFLAYGKLKNRTDEPSESARQEVLDLSNWFTAQAMEGCQKRFAPYLDFSQWK